MNVPGLLLITALSAPLLAPTAPVIASKSPPSNVSLGEVLPLLQARYPNFAGLDYKPGDSIDLLLRRSQGEILIAPAHAVPTAASPVLLTLLPDGIIYCRFASFHPAPDFGSQLGAEINAGTQGLIIDLRSTSTPDDFAGAAQVANLFLPPGTPLFFIKDAQQGAHAFVSAAPANPVHLGTLPIIVLINNRTSGAAEALAACLQSNGALTIGRWTAGNGALFEDHPLASGAVLHYVAGDVTMADGTQLWRHPLNPDIGLLVDPAKEEAVLGLIAQGKILDVIRESAGSHRLSEAALVQGQDPAVDAYLIPADKHAYAPQDSSLVTALDSLRAIRLSQRSTGPASAAADEPKIPFTAQ